MAGTALTAGAARAATGAAGTGNGGVRPAWRALAALLVAAMLAAGCAGTSTGRPASRAPVAAAPAPQGPPDRSEVVSEVVRTARSQIGSRYAWAGCSPDQGFDCSGLVWWAYDQSGVSLPRISNDQLRAGAPVSQDRLAPADLVFFQTGKNERSIHVGIYTGDGYFVHSPNHGQRVREESMRAKYWRARFIGARRVVEERAAPVQAAQSGQPARVAPAGEQQ